MKKIIIGIAILIAAMVMALLVSDSNEQYAPNLIMCLFGLSMAYVAGSLNGKK